MKRKNLIGDKFGKLTVISRSESKNGRRFWVCKCDCGNTCVVSTTHLLLGDVKSCGCARSGVNLIDLSGKKFGRLTAIDPTDKRVGNSVVWTCKCDCGKTCLVPSSYLIRGNTKSCGCLAVENGKKVAVHMKEARKDSYVAHTDILLISDPQKKNSRNTSGCRGVSWDTSVNLWKSYINFQGKRYYLGGFKDIEPAIAARRAAEKEIYGNFLEWYKDNFKRGGE